MPQMPTRPSCPIALLGLALLLVTACPSASRKAAMPLPPYLEPVTWADTGTIITRVTDQRAFGVGDRVLKHDYARRAAWNADGSRLLLVHPYPARILDAADFGTFEVHDTPADPLWSNTDPLLIYGLADGNAFVRYSIATRRTSVLRVFDGYSELSIGGGEGVQSADDRYVALLGRRAGGIDVIVYDLVADSVQRLPLDGLTGPDGDVDWAGVSPSGTYFVLKIDRTAADRGFDVYDRKTLRRLRRLLPGSQAHSDFGFDRDGNEVLVSLADASPAIVSARLADGFVRRELPAAMTSYNVHVSCRNVLRPGWCYVSTYSDTSGRSARFYRSIFSVKLDGSGQVEEFAPAMFAQDPADLLYERQSQAVPSPRGDQVLFASDWGDGSPQAVVHDYVARRVSVATAPASSDRPPAPPRSGPPPPGR